MKQRKPVDAWQSAIKRVEDLCDEMIAELGYNDAAVIVEMKKRLLTLKFKPKEKPWNKPR